MLILYDSNHIHIFITNKTSNYEIPVINCIIPGII